MSELEMQRREEYRRNRKKWTIIQLVAIAVLVAISLGSFLVYNRLNRTYYIEYTEKGSADYSVKYKDNQFFDKEWIEENQTYISSLVETMTADFNYNLKTESSDLGFNYVYKVDANLIIANKDNGTPYYTQTENISQSKEKSFAKGENVRFSESVVIDYAKYDAIARSFVTTYGLENSVSCTLVVTLDVDILSSSEEFYIKDQSKYSTSLNIPLAVDSFNITSTSSAPDDEIKVLEYQNSSNPKVFSTIAIIGAFLALALVVALVIFLRLTENEDITYAAKVRKILRAYGAYIQRINGEFDYEGYQSVAIKTFPEMLGIRDTIQSPVLMSENSDETMTRFLIPTNTKILYVFEIKVDNYDEIYNKEEPKVLEEIDEEVLAEAMSTADLDIENIEFIPDDDDQYEVAPEEPGIEVIGVVWPERDKHNKVYRYDPNGETLEKGDIVLAPTFDAAKGRDVIRKVAVAHGNHRVDPEHIKHPLKKIVAVVKKGVSHSLTPNTNKIEKNK